MRKFPVTYINICSDILLMRKLLVTSSEPIYDVDVKKLRLVFLRKQQQVHPDSYAQKSTVSYGLFKERQQSLSVTC